MAMFSLANAAGAAFRAALNTVLGKLHGNYYGSTDPSAAAESTPGMLWVDTSGGTPVLKARNAADTGWITLGALDPSAFQLAGTSAFGRSLIDDASSTVAHGTLGTLSFLGNKLITQGDDLGDTANLDFYSTGGYYWQNRDADAAAGTRYPIPRGGALTVYKHNTLDGTTGAGAAQTYISRYVAADGGARMFFRSEFGFVWSPWQEIAAAPVGTSFACRAWVNFNGTGTPSIRASGNVSSITDLGTGNYRINFTTPMPDTNFATVATASTLGDLTGPKDVGVYTKAVGSVTFTVRTPTNDGNTDPDEMSVAIFR